MRYTCTSCDHHFESKEARPRCPRCMRRHGLIPEDAQEGVTDESGGRTRPGWASIIRRRWLLALTSAVVVAGVTVAVILLLRPGGATETPRAVGLGPVAPETLRKVAEQRGVALSWVAFAQDDAVRSRGGELGREGDIDAVARGILDLIGGVRAPSGPVSVRPPGRFKVSPLLGASSLLDAIQKKREVTVLSYELASLYLALARAAGLHAVMVEIHRHRDAKRPADPSGFEGAFGVALYAGRDMRGRPVKVADPVRGALDEGGDFEVLTDLRAAAHGMMLQAIHKLKANADLPGANEASRGAVKLAPNSATVRAGRGMVLLESGAMDPALDALRQARQLREDAPRLLCLAMGYLAKRKVDRASSLLDKAISSQPRYARAYAMKALFLLAQGKQDEAAQQLDKAQEIEPSLPEALQARAMLLLASEKTTQALALLRKAVSLDPMNEQARFQLWRVLYMLGEQEEAQEAARQWLATLPQGRRSQTRKQIAAFKKMLDEQRSAAGGIPGGGAPHPPAGAPGAGVLGSPGGSQEDPYKLKMPGGDTSGSGSGGPFGKSPGSDPMLQY